MRHDGTGAHRIRERKSVPGTGGPGSEETAPDGQRALRLHAGISAIAVVFSAFVTVLFATMLDSPVLAVVFGVVTLVSAGWGLWAVSRLRATRDATR